MGNTDKPANLEEHYNTIMEKLSTLRAGLTFTTGSETRRRSTSGHSNNAQNELLKEAKRVELEILNSQLQDANKICEKEWTRENAMKCRDLKREIRALGGTVNRRRVM